jgi:tRNA threonylcarbamoyladenosine biosynthesis protein TsaE
MKPRKSRRKRREKGLLSRSPEETERIGREIARSLRVPGVILLRGALGSGKTTLTRGIAVGLGLSDPGRVNSPSFTLVNIYQGACPIYHVDLYRLEGKRDLYSIGIDEFLGTEGVTIVEWSEKLSSRFSGAVEVEIEDAGGDQRMLYVVYPVPAGHKGK